MVNESPASVLFSRDGYDVVITDGYTITASRPAIIAAGKDGQEQPHNQLVRLLYHCQRARLQKQLLLLYY